MNYHSFLLEIPNFGILVTIMNKNFLLDNPYFIEYEYGKIQYLGSNTTTNHEHYSPETEFQKSELAVK